MAPTDQAALTVQAGLTAQYVAQQRLLSTTLIRDLVLLLRAVFGGTDPAGSWPVTKMALGSMIRDRRRQSVDLASPYYQQVRHAAGVPGSARIIEPPALDLDRLDATLNATGIATYQRSVNAGADPIQARDRMAVTLSGSASQLALEGGRQVVHDTVLSDDEAIGWARVDDGDPCSWCAMLISRSAVYRNAGTAGQKANKRFVGDGMFKFHNHDGCSAVPVFNVEDPVLKRADDLYDQWLANTAGHSGKKAVEVWRQYWDSRDAGDGAQQTG